MADLDGSDRPAGGAPTGDDGVDPGRSWDNRARAESFGAGADTYDEVRPRYPDAVVDALVAGRPERQAAGTRLQVLDLGTGTGILARALLAREVVVVGSDVDDAMAAVARRHGLTVHVGRFEDLPRAHPELTGWADRITAGQAWHWIEPEAGLAAACRLLAPGGQLWLLWNFGGPTGDVLTELDAVYADHPALSRQSVVRGGGERAADQAATSIAQQPGTVVTTLTHQWTRVYSKADCLRLLTTHSDHATLPAVDRERLLQDVGEVVDRHGGELEVAYTTRAVVVDGLQS